MRLWNYEWVRLKAKRRKGKKEKEREREKEEEWERRKSCTRICVRADSFSLSLSFSLSGWKERKHCESSSKSAGKKGRKGLWAKCEEERERKLCWEDTKDRIFWKGKKWGRRIGQEEKSATRKIFLLPTEFHSQNSCRNRGEKEKKREEKRERKIHGPEILNRKERSRDVKSQSIKSWKTWEKERKERRERKKRKNDGKTSLPLCVVWMTGYSNTSVFGRSTSGTREILSLLSLTLSLWLWSEGESEKEDDAVTFLLLSVQGWCEWREWGREKEEKVPWHLKLDFPRILYLSVLSLLLSFCYYSRPVGFNLLSLPLFLSLSLDSNLVILSMKGIFSFLLDESVIPVEWCVCVIFPLSLSQFSLSLSLSQFSLYFQSESLPELLLLSSLVVSIRTLFPWSFHFSLSRVSLSPYNFSIFLTFSPHFFPLSGDSLAVRFSLPLRLCANWNSPPSFRAAAGCAAESQRVRES